jgi:signal transduction histidine kinase
MSIEDDGVGFSHEQARARLRDGHFGLVGMRERIELSGGRWNLDSTPGRGTRITVSLPDLTGVSVTPVRPSEIEFEHVVPA